MTIWEYTSFTKFVSIKNYNDWFINCDLTKFHHSISTQILSYLEGLMSVEDSWKYSFCQRKKKFLTKVGWSLYHTSDITKFQTLQRIQSIPTLSRVLFYRGIDESRDRFKHFMESEPRGKVVCFFDITRITCIRIILSEGLKCKKVKYWRNFLHIIILTKFQKNCSKFQNCDLSQFHDLLKIGNFCPRKNVKFIFFNKSFFFPHDWHRLSIWQSFRTNCSDKKFIMIGSDR